jgi:hypothetical protein
MFKHRFADHVRACANVSADARPLKLFSCDEARFGLKTVLRRRLTLKGIKPVIGVQHAFENTYLFGAVCPQDGQHALLELPELNTQMFQLFLGHLSQSFPDTLNVLVCDNGAFHKSRSLRVPENIRLLFLPPYCPELNPIERFWLYCKDQLANQVFESLTHLSDMLCHVVQSISCSLAQSLTAYPLFRQFNNAYLSP